MSSTWTSWAIILPVKSLAVAKSRLLVDDEVRRELALAMALDTARAAVDCLGAAAVFAVSDDPVATEALQELGVRVFPDRPDAGLNPALRHGAEQAVAALGGDEVRIAAVSSDLPALRPADLQATLDLAAGVGRGLVADLDGRGTTLLSAADLAGFVPAFGAGSRQAHLAAGVQDLTRVASESVRRDVDTLQDLRSALGLGVGPATTDVLRRRPTLLG